MRKVSKTKTLTTTSMLISLSSVLSMIKIWNMPWGGSITLLSMLPVMLISIKYGLKKGFISSIIYAFIQLIMGIIFDGLLAWGLTPVMLISCIFLDYIVAFGILFIAGIFRKKGLWGYIFGCTTAISIRFVAHYFSGVFIFASVGKLWEGFETQNTYLYSLLYNGAYMLPELIFTGLGIYFLLKAPKTAEFLLNN